MVLVLIATILYTAISAAMPAAATPGVNEFRKGRQGPKERFIPVEGMRIVCDPLPTEAANLAVGHFVREIKRMTGKSLPIVYGLREGDQACLIVGNRSTLGRVFIKNGYRLPRSRETEDTANQSYVVDASPHDGSGQPVVLAAGFGLQHTARGYLGTSYALGELLRRLDIRKGQWGFVLPMQPILASPRMPNRTLYLMNSNNCNPGLSLEYFSDAQLEDYVDFLVDARYSRISFWQWSNLYLYPGNAEDQRARNEQIHQAMRKVFDRARRRGLEVYHQLAPAHVSLALLPSDPKFRATGYYGSTSVCWSQPEAREIARKVVQTEMEYYGPMDGYTVWFYDPGGCFCQDCAAHQADRLFDQLMTVVDLAKTISPNAKFEAVLWPTWDFTSRKDIGFPGKGYTAEDVKAFVEDFLAQCLAKFGPRGLTIMDSCEADNTNLYNGFVKPEAFQRDAFMYSVLGMASEESYPFAAFRLRYLREQMGKACDRGIEGGQLFIQYAATNYPGVFAFADTLYAEDAGWESTAQRLASTWAKGDSCKPFLRLLAAMEDLDRATSLGNMENAVRHAEDAAAQIERSPYFYGDRDWLKGYVEAQRYYLQLAQAMDEKTFTEILTRFRADLAALPMYRDYAARTLNPALAHAHIKQYWHLSVK
jgi:hypothetical protein